MAASSRGKHAQEKGNKAQGKKGQPPAPKKQKGKKSRVVLLVLLAVLLALGGTTAWAAHRIINDPSSLFAQGTLAPQPTAPPTPSPEAAGDTPDPQVVATPEPTATPEVTPALNFDKNRINILVLGNDSSNERIAAGMNFRTDAIMLVTLDLTKNDVDIISIPRDTYVRINGGNQRSKINAAYVFGGGANKDGYRYAMDTVSWTMGGIPIDYYVGFGMQAVKDVVNAMGGIDYDVEMKFTMNGRTTQAGPQHLDGQAALDYARFRGTGRGDIDRIDRQQRVIFAMFEQMQSKDQLKNIPKIYEAVMEQIDTNLDLMQIGALAYWARNLNMEKINRHTLEGSGLNIGRTSYWVLHQNAKKDLVKEIFDVDVSIPEGEDYGSIKAQAEELGGKVSELMGILDPLRTGVQNGLISDPAILQAVHMGDAALMTEKRSEVENALAALRPYAGYVPPGGTITDPNDPLQGGGEIQPPFIPGGDEIQPPFIPGDGGLPAGDGSNMLG